MTKNFLDSIKELVKYHLEPAPTQVDLTSSRGVPDVKDGEHSKICPVEKGTGGGNQELCELEVRWEDWCANQQEVAEGFAPLHLHIL